MAKADPHLLYDDAAEVADSAGPEADRLDRAFAGLDAALSRLERAATLRPPVDTQVLELKLQNAALRDTVGGALEQVDSLLADLNGDG